MHASNDNGQHKFADEAVNSMHASNDNGQHKFADEAVNSIC